MEIQQAITLWCAEFVNDNINNIAVSLHTQDSCTLHANEECLNCPLGAVISNWTTMEMKEFAFW